MGLTPNHLLPYPEDTDPPDVPSDIYALANRLDNVLTALGLQTNTTLDDLAQRVEALETFVASQPQPEEVPSS